MDVEPVVAPEVLVGIPAQERDVLGRQPRVERADVVAAEDVAVLADERHEELESAPTTVRGLATTSSSSSCARSSIAESRGAPQRGVCSSMSALAILAKRLEHRRAGDLEPLTRHAGLHAREQVVEELASRRPCCGSSAGGTGRSARRRAWRCSGFTSLEAS